MSKQVILTEWNPPRVERSIDLPEEIRDLAEENDLMIIERSGKLFVLLDKKGRSFRARYVGE